MTRDGQVKNKKKKEKVTRRSMSPHPSLSFNHLQQYNWAQSLRLTVGLSLNVPLMPVLIGASMVLNPAARCCLLPDTLYVLNGCFRCLPSCIVFMHYRLHAPPLPSSFKGWVSRFFFHALRNKKKTRLACWRREFWGKENWNGNLENLAKIWKIMVLFKSWSSWTKVRLG